MANESPDRSVPRDPGPSGDNRLEHGLSSDPAEGREDPLKELRQSKQVTAERWVTVGLHAVTLVVVVGLLVMMVIQREQSAQMAEARAEDRQAQTELITERLDEILDEAVSHSLEIRDERDEQLHQLLEEIREVRDMLAEH